jgi:hemerythrin-like metal-binding protein
MLIEWSPSLATGDARIDQDHQYIIARLNQIWDKLDHDISRHEMEDMLLDYCNYCSKHFHYEENCMVDHRYPGYKLHRKHHKDMLDFFETMMLRFEIVKDVSRDQLRAFVNMIAEHIQDEDKRMAAFIQEQVALTSRPGP